MQARVVTINGLPLHPLVVHLAVVAAPVAGLLALAYLVPRWRHALRWPVLIAGIVAAGSVWSAAATGDALTHAAALRSAIAAHPGLAQAIHQHEELAGKLQASTWVLGGLSVLVWWFHSRPGWIRAVLLALLPLAGATALVLVVLTGDAGARAVWTA